MTTIEIFSERLMKVRKERNIKRQNAADEIGISRASLEYYEKGKRKPDIEVLASLAKYYNVSADYLLGFSETESFDENKKAISKHTGLTGQSIENLVLYKALKEKEEIRNYNLSNETNDKQKLHDIDIINYFLENVSNFLILEYFKELATINFHYFDEKYIDIEDELLDVSVDLYDLIFDNGSVLLGERYKIFLEQEIVNEFKKILYNFSIDINPYEQEYKPQRFENPHISLKKRVEDYIDKYSEENKG